METDKSVNGGLCGAAGNTRSNNEVKVAQKQSEQYFNVDARLSACNGVSEPVAHDLGPGSSIKPIVATAVTSGLKAEWQRLQFKPVKNLVNGYLIQILCRLKAGRKGWKMGTAGTAANYDVNFIRYLANQHWYHS